MPTGISWGVVSIFVVMVAALAWIGLRYFCQPLQIDHAAQPEKRPSQTLFRFGFAPKNWPELIWRNWKYWLSPLLIFLVLGAGIYLALLLSAHHSAAGLNLYELNGEQHIRQALVKEVLAPPPPLPPALFVSTDHIDLAGADRDWNKLDPVFTQQVLQLFARMEARGYPLALLEGYRSAERQDMLAAKGNNVTQAAGNQSKHQFGLAVDVAPIKNGELHIDEKDPWAASGYAVLGEEAERLGLTWGGHWSFRDYGHIELPGNLSALRKAQATRNTTIH
ncbi:MAG: M15 family metallopeptidase [Formivibrio sp.]|nr:M15 family metallopeptidase [Formivibrio sp.]